MKVMETNERNRKGGNEREERWKRATENNGKGN